MEGTVPEKKLTPKPAGSPTPDAAASGPSSRLPEPDETPVPESQAAAIVTALEKGDGGDDDETVTSGARDLRDLLRHYV